jgi:uracil phosphoribosyltransferase|uniref:Uracil phosphoribosyltransferase n=1 Tax=Palmaria decipiens TaxID=187399 RepID=A0A6C0W484_PALDE|nr:uracil phosphoribosyltransferase [Palmaria decipiens]QIC19476.1 uracil phosphoribosyltransferase [Palmaria decipiens]
MSLNIYSIKHPLVLNWTSSITHSNVSSRDKVSFLKKISSALIYEATRKSIETINLSIKNMDKYRRLSLLPQQLSYLILTDAYLSQVLSTDINALLPSTTIYPIHKINTCVTDKLMSQDLVLEHVIVKSLGKHLMVLLKNLNSGYSYRVLQILQSNECTSNQIQICCITCSTEALQVLNTHKHNIDIYTAKIFDDDEYSS